MKTALFAFLIVLSASSAAAQDRARIGLLPFDIANVGVDYADWVIRRLRRFRRFSFWFNEKMKSA